MGKAYEDLSRRALIKLDHDFDAENDEALLKYLESKENEYENIRFIEKVTVKTDQLGESLKESAKKIRDACFNEADRMVDTAISSVVKTTAEVVKKVVKGESIV